MHTVFSVLTGVGNAPAITPTAEMIGARLRIFGILAVLCAVAVIAWAVPSLARMR
jgi:hypothetical protein